MINNILKRVYISENGIQMLQGNKMNWQYEHINADDTGEMVCSYCFGGLLDMWIVNYYPDRNEVRIANMDYDSNPALVFKVNDLDDAENLALSITAGMKQEVMPLYIRL